MKKHNEGYILAYVFVILVVICLIALSAISVPLANLRLQKASVEKMQQQYMAQGVIENALATLCDELPDINDNITSVYLPEVKGFVEKCTAPGTEKGILYVVTDESVRDVKDIKGDGLYVTSDITWSGNQKHTCAFTLTAVSGSAMVTMGVELQDVIEGTKIVAPKIVCKSYTISQFEPSAQAGQEGGGGNAS